MRPHVGGAWQTRGMPDASGPAPSDSPTEPAAIGTPGGTPERPALFFSGPDEFRAWLEANHDTATELWMGLYKKHVAERPLTWEQAVPVALCFGWIDSVSQRIDDDAVRQRWSPRKPSSTWSKVNVELVEQLTAQGLMTEAGLAAYARRRDDRTGTYSHENPDQQLPPEWAARIEADAAAAAFLAAATPTYRRQTTHWVLSAKQPATRERRLEQLIRDSAAGEVVPFQRYGEVPKWVARAAAAARAAG